MPCPCLALSSQQPCYPDFTENLSTGVKQLLQKHKAGPVVEVGFKLPAGGRISWDGKDAAEGGVGGVRELWSEACRGEALGFGVGLPPPFGNVLPYSHLCACCMAALL